LSQSPHQASLREQPLTLGLPPGPALIVLDTNVVLDWLLFNDPSSTPFAAAIARGEVRWVASPAMRGELVEVLRRGLAAARHAGPARLLATWDDHATLLAEPPRLPGTVPLNCSDPDDQKFLDLAHAAGARWLLSRDRAVLRLARRAAAFGIDITVPERWSLAA
jgi:predicted nucleic acid-binding protein